jgi:hypothetical protein
MKKRTKAIALQVPLIALVILAFIGSLVAKIGGLYPLSWGTPIIMAIIVGLYFWGRKIEKETMIRKH